MNNIQSSSMSKFYLSLYDYAYELEYGCIVIMFIIYELVLSSCAMFLICSSLFFIVHCWAFLTSLPKVDLVFYF